MHEKPAPRILSRLAHPLVMLALGVILLNALIFQPLSPTWLTGKLADLAWMIVLPVVGASLLGLIWRGQENRAFWISTVVISVSFVLAKTLPVVNSLLRGLFICLFGVSLKLALDPTDLLALAGVILAAWIWRHPWRIPARMWRFAPLVLLVMAGIADAVDPGYDQIDCLAVDGEALVAFTPERSTAYIGNNSERKAYLSRDNGRTWEDLGLFTVNAEGEDGLLEGIAVAELTSECQPWNQQTLVNDPVNPQVYYMIVSNQGVYRSWDGGETLARDYRVEEGVEFMDVVFAPDGRTLVVAASQHGVLLRRADGMYTWADPSGLSLPAGD